MGRGPLGLSVLASFMSGLALIIMNVVYRTTDQQHTNCYQWWWWPLIGIGCAIVVVSLLGLLGFASKLVIMLYAFCVAFGGFASIGIATAIFVVTGYQGAYVTTGVAYTQYTIYGYSSWLASRIINNWMYYANIMGCLKSKNICSGLPTYPPDTSFLSMNLNALQGGCCFPPSSCITVGVGSNANCAVYSSSNQCFACSSCQGAFANNLRDVWRQYAIGLYCVGGVLLFAMIGAFMGISKSKKQAEYAAYDANAAAAPPVANYGAGVAYQPPMGTAPATYGQPAPYDVGAGAAAGAAAAAGTQAYGPYGVYGPPADAAAPPPGAYAYPKPVEQTV